MSYLGAVENRRVDGLLGDDRPVVDKAVLTNDDLNALRRQWSEIEAVPVLIEHRREGIDHSWAGIDVRTLLRGEQSAGRFSAHDVVLAPGAGIAPHWFHDTHTYVLVVDGSVQLTVGNATDVVGQHSLGFAPPKTRIGFRNTTDAPATLILVYSPAGADRAFGAAHDQWTRSQAADESVYQIELERFGFHFDDSSLPNDTLTNAEAEPMEFEFKGEGDLERLRQEFLRRPAIPRLIRTTPDEFDATAAGASRRKELIGGDDNSGHAMLNLLSGLPGFGAPPHHQPTEDEFFFITGGELEMAFGEEAALALRPSAMAFCPKNCTHGFFNRTEEEVRFVTLNAPAGHERAMAAVRTAMANGATKEQLYELSVAGGFIFHSLDALG